MREGFSPRCRGRPAVVGGASAPSSSHDRSGLKSFPQHTGAWWSMLRPAPASVVVGGRSESFARSIRLLSLMQERHAGPKKNPCARAGARRVFDRGHPWSTVLVAPRPRSSRQCAGPDWEGPARGAHARRLAGAVDRAGRHPSSSGLKTIVPSREARFRAAAGASNRAARTRQVPSSWQLMRASGAIAHALRT